MRIPFFNYPAIYKKYKLDFQKIFEDIGDRGAFIMQNDLAEFEDIIENNILQNLKNKSKVENLESKLRKSITKEIKLLWGKKPFVEIFLHYNEN